MLFVSLYLHLNGCISNTVLWPCRHPEKNYMLLKSHLTARLTWRSEEPIQMTPLSVNMARQRLLNERDMARNSVTSVERSGVCRKTRVSKGCQLEYNWKLNYMTVIGSKTFFNSVYVDLNFVNSELVKFGLLWLLCALKLHAVLIAPFEHLIMKCNQLRILTRC